MITKQETFDTVARHLLAQNKKARESEGSGVCMYRAPDGSQCAAGCLIPDELYERRLEYCSVVDKWSGDRPTRVGEIIVNLGHDLGLVQDLQRVHDGPCTEVEEWPSRLRDVASKHGLSAAVVDAHVAGTVLQ